MSKGGLTVYIERDLHLHSTNRAAKLGDLVAIWTPRNRVQNGFYVAIGNAGSMETRTNLDSRPEIVRVYFNLAPEGAVAIMASLTQHLNRIQVPFSFKVLYNPSEYKRYDSGVLYFQPDYYKAVWQVLENVYLENCFHFRTEVPLFTKLLAPGLGLAEEPDFKFSAQESFGMNRCQIIANGLLEAWHVGNESPESRIASIYQQFSLAGIDLRHSYLNANSQDIYTPLDLTFELNR